MLPSKGSFPPRKGERQNYETTCDSLRVPHLLTHATSRVEHEPFKKTVSWVQSPYNLDKDLHKRCDCVCVQFWPVLYPDYLTSSPSFCCPDSRLPIWGFPKMGVPLLSSILMGFSLINHLFLRYPHLWKPPYHIPKWSNLVLVSTWPSSWSEGQDFWAIAIWVKYKLVKFG